MSSNDLSLLVTRPNHDLPTNYLYFWTEELVEEAKSRDITVYDLKSRKANRKDFESYVKKNKPKIVMLNGHGNDSVVCGHENEKLIILGENEDIIKNCIVYARSCNSAKCLAEMAVSKGTVAFIGYTRKFIFISSPDKSTKPMNDKIARFFLEPSNTIVRVLLKGQPAKEAHLRSKREAYKKMKYLLSDQATSEEQALLPYLWQNTKAQVIFE